MLKIQDDSVLLISHPCIFSTLILLLIISEFLFCYPFYTLSIFPVSISNFSFCVIINSNSFLFPIHPCTIILTTIRPCENTMSLFFVIEIITLILSTISPSENTLSMHFVTNPITCEFSSISPFILSMTMNIVV